MWKGGPLPLFIITIVIAVIVDYHIYQHVEQLAATWRICSFNILKVKHIFSFNNDLITMKNVLNLNSYKNNDLIVIAGRWLIREGGWRVGNYYCISFGMALELQCLW